MSSINKVKVSEERGNVQQRLARMFIPRIGLSVPQSIASFSSSSFG